MENPQSWNKATYIINEVIEEYRRAERVEGGSLAAKISYRLRRAGFLTPESQDPQYPD